ncbi:MAG: hypothetical protein AAF125_17365 [Chloroflexota bacterium]
MNPKSKFKTLVIRLSDACDALNDNFSTLSAEEIEEYITKIKATAEAAAEHAEAHRLRVEMDQMQTLMAAARVLSEALYNKTVQQHVYLEEQVRVAQAEVARITT